MPQEETTPRTSTGEMVDQSSTTSTPESATPTTPTTPTEKPNEKSQIPSSTEATLLNKDAPKEAAAGAPDAYAEFRVPDGYALDADTAQKAGAIFKGLNLSQDQAQKLVDFYVTETTQANEAPYRAWANLQKQWTDEVKKEFGRDVEPGGKVLTTVGRLIDTLPQDVARGFREAMDLTGAGSNPAFVRAFYVLAQRLGEGTSVKGAGPSPLGQKAPGEAPKSAAQAIYPHLPSSAT